MKKNNFFKITLMLIIGGFLTKVLGMITKIVITRLIGTTGVGLYMLIMPTFGLLVSLCQMGFPVAISKLVAEDRFNNKNLVLGIIPISLLVNFSIMLFLLIFGRFISLYLLKEPRTYLGIISIGFVLPFISISSILRAYYFGRERMFPHVLSAVMEDIIKLIVIILFVPTIYEKGIEYVVSFIILTSILSELSSIIIFTLFLPKRFKLKKEYFKPDRSNLKSIFSISLPTTGSRLIGSIGYFFEPIILTFCLTLSGYSNDFIVTEYGILNGYVMPLLLLPSFFTSAISQALIPVISKAYSNKNYKYTKVKIKQAIFYCLLIGIPCTLVFTFFPEIPLKLIYNTSEGLNYIKFLAPICIFHYIQAPLTGVLQAMGKAKEAMKGTIFGMTLRTILLFILSFFKIGLWSLVLTISINIICVTLFDAKKVKEALS